MIVMPGSLPRLLTPQTWHYTTCSYMRDINDNTLSYLANAFKSRFTNGFSLYHMRTDSNNNNASQNHSQTLDEKPNVRTHTRITL